MCVCVCDALALSVAAKMLVQPDNDEHLRIRDILVRERQNAGWFKVSRAQLLPRTDVADARITGVNGGMFMCAPVIFLSRLCLLTQCALKACQQNAKHRHGQILDIVCRIHQRR